MPGVHKANLLGQAKALAKKQPALLPAG